MLVNMFKFFEISKNAFITFLTDMSKSLQQKFSLHSFKTSSQHC